MFRKEYVAMSQTEFSKCECRHCAGHIEFPVEAGGQRIACPHCGQPTELPALLTPKKSRRARMVLSMAVLLIVVIAIALLFLKKSAMVSAPGKAFSTATNPPALKVVEETTTNGFAFSALKLEKTPGSSLTYVTGTIRNLNDRQRFGVKAEFTLFATNGAAAGKASDYAPTLEKNGVWKFKALVMESKAATATLNFIREDQ